MPKLQVWIVVFSYTLSRKMKCRDLVFPKKINKTCNEIFIATTTTTISITIAIITAVRAIIIFMKKAWKKCTDFKNKTISMMIYCIITECNVNI